MRVGMGPSPTSARSTVPTALETMQCAQDAFRSLEGAPVLFAGGARPGELADNPAALSTARSLGRAERVLRLDLEPLGAEEVAEPAAGMVARSRVIVLARALLARCELSCGDREGARSHVDAAPPATSTPSRPRWRRGPAGRAPPARRTP
jgi:hypothetical protein